ncbi:alpha/beta hydrolase fold [Nakaseomyces glabratus]|nr:alpha/beta hydrolase fold [Nakaseomyces glabratus]
MPTSIIASDKSVKSLPQTSLNQSEMNGDYSNEQVDERQLAVSTNTTVENEREPLINVPESKRNIGGRYSSNECVNREAHDNDNPALAVAHNIQDKLYQMHKDYRVFIHNSKWILNLMILLNTIWLVITFINDFFFNMSLFGYSNRYGSFNDLCLIFVAIVANSLNLWFNQLGLYSSLDVVQNISLCLLTLFNLFLLLIVKYTRERIGSIAIFTYLWTAFAFVIGSVLDFYLLKFNDELYKNNNIIAERETQSHEQYDNKHTLREWLYIAIRSVAKLGLLIFMAFYTLNTLLTAWDISRTSNTVVSSYPSQMVFTEAASYENYHWVDDNHTYKIHITCYGDIFNNTDLDNDNNQAIVLFEHGGYDTGYRSGTWIQELYHLNRIKRFCMYERPGYGLSDSPPAPISISMVAEGLKYALLNEARIKGPFVTVGYDMGGLFTRVFTAKNIDIVQGMMLVDAWHEDLLLKNYLKRMLPPVDDDDPSRNPDDRSWLPQEIGRHNEFKLWWQGLWSTLGLRLQSSWLVAHHGSRDRIFGRDLPYQGRFLRAKFLESITSSILSYRDVINSNDRLIDVKTSIVSSKDMVKKSYRWGNWQRELTKISRKTQEWKVVDGGHEVYKYNLGKQQTQDVLLRLVGEKDRY